MFLDWPLLSLVIWTPIVGGLLLLALPKKEGSVNSRIIALLISILTFILSIPLYTDFNITTVGMQFTQNIPWIESFKVCH